MEAIQEDLAKDLREKLGDAVLHLEQTDLPTIFVKREKIFQVIRTLYDDRAFAFRFLTTITGMHFPDGKDIYNRPVGIWSEIGEPTTDKEFLGLVYQLHNLEKNQRLRVKIFFPLDKPEVDSVTSIFPGANWMEREGYDFFGILFKGHPNLKRILNLENMTVFPMRRDFPLEDQTRDDKDNKMFGR